jgi:dTDP-glucose 4,6-dehydratase
MSQPLDGPDVVIRDDLDRIVRTVRGDLGRLSATSLLLTGATGFIGRCLVETVIRFNEVSGRPPAVVILPTRRPQVLRARYAEQVISGEVEVVPWGPGDELELPGRRPDLVIHGAATTDPIRFGEDPSGSLRDTIAMADSVGNVATASAVQRVVLISSGAVYGDQPADLLEIPETYQGGYAVAGGASYAEAKRESERRFRDTDLDVRIARVFSVIGPYQDLGSGFAVPNLIRQAADDGVLALTSDGRARRSFCYATDLSAILFWLLLGDPRHNVYNVGSREGTTSIAEVAGAIAEMFGGLEVRRPATAISGRDYVPNVDRLYEEYVPTVGLRDGLLRTCHSLFARGLIGRRPAVELS